ncbi:CsgG/HfaB family protein [Leptospira weilii]|uniref:CsgG/HfaB family protein n=1 Tax=Leptospira weilii TaxID=28184 RepID=UPI000773B6C0|nr:CsgG/HfaB family protein [Leptospira weilii]
MKNTKGIFILTTTLLFSLADCISVQAFKGNQLKMKQVKSISVIPTVQDPKLKREITTTSESKHTVNTGGISAVGIGRDFAYALSITGPSASSEYKNSRTVKGDFIDPEIVAKNAATLEIADTLSSTFIDNGYKIVERNQLISVLNQKKPKLSGSTLEENAIELGKLAGIDAVLMIEVTKLAQKNIFTTDMSTGERVSKTQYELKYQIKLVSTQDGSIVMTGISPPTGSSTFSDSLEEYAQRMSHIIARELDGTLKAWKEGSVN